jgi:dihydrofolate reductase
VRTHRPPDGTIEPGATFVSGDIRAAAALAAAAAGERNVVIIGAAVARECLLAGLVDEIVVHLVPVLLGLGVRLLDLTADVAEDAR